MTTLAQFTEASLLVPRLTGDHHESVITELAQRLENARRIEKADVFVDAVLVHDELASSVFDGVAFPFARSKTVKELSFAVGITPHPIQWITARPPLVRMVVLIATPMSDEMRYLSLVTVFSNFLKDSQAVSNLQKCVHPEEMLAVFRQVHC